MILLIPHQIRPLGFSALIFLLAITELLASGRPVPVRQIYVPESPDSIVKGAGGKLYVSISGKREPGDGEIRVVNGLETYPFARGLDDPKGMAFDGESLLVVDGDRILSVDSEGEVSVLRNWSDFPEPPKFLRRIAISPDGVAFVSDLGNPSPILEGSPAELFGLSPGPSTFPEGRIFRFSPSGPIGVELDVDVEFLSPSGLFARSDGALLASSFVDGRLIMTASGKQQLLATGFHGADDLFEDEAGNLFVSDWDSRKVWVIPSSGGGRAVFYERLESSAGLLVDGEWLYVVDPRKSAIHRVPIREQFEYLEESLQGINRRQ